MKKILLLLAVLLLASPAFSAITFQQLGQNQGSSPITLGSSVSPGYLIVTFAWNNSISGGTPLPVVVTSTVCTGTWSTPTTYGLVGVRYFSMSYIVCNGTGTPVITFTANNGDGNNHIALVYDGFAGTPTVDLSPGAVAGSSAAPSVGPYTTTVANEVLITFFSDENFDAATTSAGWTLRASGTGSAGTFTSDDIVSTLQTAQTFTGSFMSSRNWTGALISFYDSATPTGGGGIITIPHRAL